MGIFFQRDIIQLYSNNYKNVIIKTLHAEGKGFSEKDKEKEEKNVQEKLGKD